MGAEWHTSNVGHAGGKGGHKQGIGWLCRHARRCGHSMCGGLRNGVQVNNREKGRGEKRGESLMTLRADDSCDMGERAVCQASSYCTIRVHNRTTDLHTRSSLCPSRLALLAPSPPPSPHLVQLCVKHPQQPYHTSLPHPLSPSQPLLQVPSPPPPPRSPLPPQSLPTPSLPCTPLTPGAAPCPPPTRCPPGPV